MAGSYPDVPGYRFAYDIDGTLAVENRVSHGTNTNLTSGQLKILNNEVSTDGYGLPQSVSGYVTFLFPEERNITGIMINHSGAISGNPLGWSNNTTYGLDGDWTVVPSVSSSSFTDKSGYRTSIQVVTINNANAIRLTLAVGGSRILRNVHIYGLIPTNNSRDRLRVMDTTTLDIAAQLDYGNIKQRASATRQFKIINNSSTLTASAITVSLDAVTDASPGIVGQLQISTDNVAYANAINIGSLSPGASSGTLYIRNNVASNAQLGPWNARIIAHPVSWS